MSQMEKYCRLCAQQKKDSMMIDMSLSNDLATKASLLSVDINADDGLPKAVCPECNEKLEKTIAFMKSVAEAQTTLKTVLEKVKEEIQSDSDDDPSFEINLDNNDVCEDDLPIIQLKPKQQKINGDLTDSWLDYPWLCSVCNITLPDRDTLWQHCLECHQICVKYTCVDCHKIKKTYGKYDRFVNHVVTHRKHLYNCCFVCNKRFTNDDEILKHWYSHKNDKNVCGNCGKVFKNVEDYSEHLLKFGKKRKSSKEDTFACKHCNKRFKCRANRQVHESIHTRTSKDFICHQCGKSFFNRSALSTHLISHDDNKSFKCEICGHLFRTNAQLRLHVGIHGGVKPFSCEQCGRQFRLKTHLKSHLIIHTDSMPFVCSVCGKKFRFRTILTQHIRQHTGHKPYSCSACLKDFTNWPNYNKHMKRRHGVDTSKKKHTPAGVFPVNPVTGELQYRTHLDANAEEWKNKVLEFKKPGRPKQKNNKKVEKLPANQVDEKNFMLLDVTETRIEKQEMKVECWS